MSKKKKYKHRDTYEKRNQLLLDMGYTCYDDYLSSSLWQSIRARALYRYGGLCRFCLNSATEVHHLRYDSATLLGKTLTALVPLCRRCHHKLEFSKRGRKYSLKVVQENYQELLKKPWKYLRYALRTFLKKS